MSEPRGLMQILEELLKTSKRLACEQKATRQVIRYWIKELAGKETVVNVTVPSPPHFPAVPSSSKAVKEYYKRKEEKKKEE